MRVTQSTDQMLTSGVCTARRSTVQRRQGRAEPNRGDRAMHIPGLAEEYERTCDDCGTSWRVPKWAAHPHMQGLPMRAPWGTAAMEANAIVEANAELAERAAGLRRCPKCESDHYKQRAIRS
jgi:hypothetical protein